MLIVNAYPININPVGGKPVAQLPPEPVGANPARHPNPSSQPCRRHSLVRALAARRREERIPRQRLAL